MAGFFGRCFRGGPLRRFLFGRSGYCFRIVRRFFCLSAFGRPGGDLLSHALRRSTIGANRFHGRVRDGIGWFTIAITTKSSKSDCDDVVLARAKGRASRRRRFLVGGNEGLPSAFAAATVSSGDVFSHGIRYVDGVPLFLHAVLFWLAWRMALSSRSSD